MMAVVVLAYTLTVIYGLTDFKEKIRLKKHGSPEMSVFRWGLDKWQDYLTHWDAFIEKILSFIKGWLKKDYHQQKLHVP